MSLADPLGFQEVWIADIKSYSAVLNSGTYPFGTFPEEVRESEWQGTDFIYPNIRVGLDFIPSINGCGPDAADVYLDIFAEDKSSKLASSIASTLYGLYHKKPFTRNGIRFSVVVVRKITKPERSIYAWMSRVHIYCEGNNA